MPKADLAAGARIECRNTEWLVRSLGLRSHGQQKGSMFLNQELEGGLNSLGITQQMAGRSSGFASGLNARKKPSRLAHNEEAS